MPLINLIQEQRFGARRRAQQARALFLAFAGIVVASTLANLWIILERGQLGNEEAQLLRQKERLAPIIKQIRTQETALAELRPRLATLEAAQKTIVRWSQILDEVAASIPPDAYLTSVRCDQADPQRPVVMTLIGLTDSQEAAGVIMLNLQKSQNLANLSLKMTQGKQIEARRAIEFQLTAEIKGTEAKRPTDEKKGAGA
jgi:Tfp pilus assembly protein PilN